MARMNILDTQPLCAAFDSDMLVLIAFAVFGLIRFLFNKKDDSDPETKAPRIPSAEQLEQERRTREVQEEIRRRLAEKIAGANQQQSRQSPAAPAQRPAPNFDRRTTQPAPQQRPVVVQTSRGTDYMAKLAEVMKLEEDSAARYRKAAEQARAMEAKAHAGAVAAAQQRETAESARAYLSKAGSLREMVIMSEILGAPLSERRQPGCPGMGE
jgi:DNA primase